MSTTPTSSGPVSSGVTERLISGWSDFWFAPADATILGLIRICLGLLVLYVHLVYSSTLPAYFGEQGWVDLEFVNAHRLEDEQYIPDTTWNEPDYSEDAEFTPAPKIRRGHAVWSIWFHVTDPVAVERIHFGMLFVMVLFTLGFWTRVTTILTWLSYLSGVHRLPQMVYGMDITISILLFYLMFGPSGAALSLDRLLTYMGARRRNAMAQIPSVSSAGANFSLRLMQIHLCFMYLMAGLCKLQGSSWWNGTAVWNTLINYELSLVRYTWYADALRSLMQNRWLGELLVTFGTVYTLVVEIAFPFLVWNQKLRWPMIVSAMMLHLGIAVFMGLVQFSLSMMILVLCFLPPEQVASTLNWLGQVACETGARLWSRKDHQENERVVDSSNPSQPLQDAGR